MFLSTRKTVAESELTVAKVYLPSLVDSLLEQQLMCDVENFLASFGGALGLWLGVRFSIVLHILMFFLNAIVRLLWKAPPAKKADATQLESVRIGNASAAKHKTSTAALDLKPDAM